MASHSVFYVRGLNHTLHATLATKPEKIVQVVFSETTGQNLCEQATNVNVIANPTLSGTWTGGTTLKAPTGWANYLAEEGTDVSSQELADLPTGYTSGAHQAMDADAEGIRTPTDIAIVLGNYYLNRLWIKVVSGTARTYTYASTAFMSATYTNAGWERKRVCARSGINETQYYYVRSNSGAATWKFTGVRFGQTYGHPCMLYASDGTKWTATAFWVLTETTTKLWVDSIQTGAGGKTINAVAIYQRGNVAAGVGGKLVA